MNRIVVTIFVSVVLSVVSLSGCSSIGLGNSSAATPKAEACAPSSPSDASCPTQYYLDQVALRNQKQAAITKDLESPAIVKLQADQRELFGLQNDLKAMVPQGYAGYDEKTRRFILAPPAPTQAPAPAPAEKK